jgi:hypothetical protein
MNSLEILEKVATIMRERQDQYGESERAIRETALLASVMLGKEILPKDVAMIYLLNKIVRNKESVKFDNLADSVGYLMIHHEAALKEVAKGDLCPRCKHLLINNDCLNENCVDYEQL